MLQSLSNESFVGRLRELTGDHVMRSSVQRRPQGCNFLKSPLVALAEEADGAITAKSVCQSVL